MLAAHPIWVSLELTLVGMTDNSSVILASCPTLQILYAQQNHVSDAGAIIFSKNTALKEIDLFTNDVHDEGAIAFSRNKTLNKLNLLWNRMSAVGITALYNNPYIKNIMADGDNPEREDKQILNRSTYQPYMTRASNFSNRFCYQINNMIQCMNRP
jgi:hypothetical protein